MSVLPTILMRWSWCNSYFMWLCGFQYGAFPVEYCRALYSCVFQSCLALWSHRLGKWKLVSVLLHVILLFISCARVNFCPFSLPLGVGNWLRFVIVARPGCFFFYFLLYRVYVIFSYLIQGKLCRVNDVILLCHVFFKMALSKQQCT